MLQDLVQDTRWHYREVSLRQHFYMSVTLVRMATLTAALWLCHACVSGRASAAVGALDCSSWTYRALPGRAPCCVSRLRVPDSCSTLAYLKVLVLRNACCLHAGQFVQIHDCCYDGDFCYASGAREFMQFEVQLVVLLSCLVRELFRAESYFEGLVPIRSLHRVSPSVLPTIFLASSHYGTIVRIYVYGTAFASAINENTCAMVRACYVVYMVRVCYVVVPGCLI